MLYHRSSTWFLNTPLELMHFSCKHSLITNEYAKNMLKSIAQKMKFPIKDFFSRCDQIRSKLWIWSHLLKKSLMENFIFCAVKGAVYLFYDGGPYHIETSPLICRNHSIDLLCKPMDWFLYDRDLRHERVNLFCLYRKFRIGVLPDTHLQKQKLWLT